MCIWWIGTKIKRSEQIIFAGRSWIYRRGIFNLPAIIRPFYSLGRFFTFLLRADTGKGGRPFLLDGSVKEDWWNAAPQKRKKKKKNTGEIPSMPSLRLRIYGKSLKFFAGITQSARTDMRRKGWKIVFWNWPDDWMGWRWRGQSKLAMLGGRGGGENRDGSPYMIVWASRSFVEFVGFFFYDFW